MTSELILLVDDEPSIVSLCRMYLEREGFRVQSAGDGVTALEMLKKSPPDLMILDVMLPELDGFEVCKQLRAQNDPLPILMLTARDEDYDKNFGLGTGRG